MQAELEKYGIQMPAFGKINGILATELTADEAAVQAAVVVINNAIDSGDVEELLRKLQLPAAGLTDIIPDNGKLYMEFLSAAKQAKLSLGQGKEDVRPLSPP